MLRHVLNRYAPVAMTALLSLAVACSDADSTGPNADALVGRWAVTSYKLEGMEVLNASTSLEITFTASGTYSAVASGTDGCEVTSCTETGTYKATATRMTIDPGTEDEVVCDYLIRGTVMSLTGTVEGTSIIMVLERL